MAGKPSGVYLAKKSRNFYGVVTSLSLGFILLAVLIVALNVNGSTANASASGDTYLVPGDYPTIQSAIDAAYGVGETILVSDGTYSENIDFKNKEITVLAEYGPSVTKIQGDGSNKPVVKFGNGETPESALDGFTIDNQASGNTDTRGIYIKNSAPTIRNSAIQGNSTIFYKNGGGIYIDGGGAIIQNTTIGGVGGGNSSQYGGGLYATSLSQYGLSLVDSEVSYNTSMVGAGMYLKSNSATVSLDGTTVAHNSTSQFGGGINCDNTRIEIDDSYFEGNSTPDWYNGGAIHLSGTASSATITNSTFTGNSAGGFGGAIHISGSTEAAPLTIINSEIDGNSSTNGSGGAIYLSSLPNRVIISGTSIDGNTCAQYGGGINDNNTPLSISDSTIDNNTASSFEGGGVYLGGSSADVDISYSSVSGNQGRGGAGINIGGGAHLDLSSSDVSGNENIQNNGSGGGISAGGDGTPASTTVNIEKSRIKGNRTNQYGGGIYNSAYMTIVNSTISGNVADGQSYSDCGGISNAGTLSITNSTVAGNRALRYSGGIGGGGSLTILNSIFWGNSAGVMNPQIGGSPTVKYSDIEGGYSGEGNINDDPAFIDFQQATNGNPKTGGDYHINSNSPAIDAASDQYAPSDDIDDDFRPQGPKADMGSDEYASTCTGGKPDLTLSVNSISWATMADYYNRILTVKYNINNIGGLTAYNIEVVASQASGSVICLTGMPLDVGTVGAASSGTAQIKYSVPVGINNFLAIVYATASDNCSIAYDYPGPYVAP